MPRHVSWFTQILKRSTAASIGNSLSLVPDAGKPLLTFHQQRGSHCFDTCSPGEELRFLIYTRIILSSYMYLESYRVEVRGGILCI